MERTWVSYLERAAIARAFRRRRTVLSASFYRTHFAGVRLAPTSPRGSNNTMKKNERIPSELQHKQRFTYRGAFATYVVLSTAQPDPRPGMSDRRLLFVHSDQSGRTIAMSLPRFQVCELVLVGHDEFVEHGTWLGMIDGLGDFVAQHMEDLGFAPGAAP